MKSWVVFAAFLALSCPSAASSEDILDAATLRARVAQAAGPIPHAYHEILTHHGTSSSGTVEEFALASDYRIIKNDGTFTTQHGKYKDDAWHQNQNGHTVIDQPDPGEANVETTTGASTITISADVAQQRGLSVKNALRNNVNAGGFASGDVIVPEVHARSLTTDEVAMTIVPLDVRLGDQIPLVTARINGAVAERMIFDTGGAGTL